jgi:hypothetical protein
VARLLVVLILFLALVGTAAAASFLPNQGGPLNTGSCTWRNINEVRGTWPYDYQCKLSGYWVSWRLGVIGD